MAAGLNMGVNATWRGGVIKDQRELTEKVADRLLSALTSRLQIDDMDITEGNIVNKTARLAGKYPPRYRR